MVQLKRSSLWDLLYNLRSPSSLGRGLSLQSLQQQNIGKHLSLLLCKLAQIVVAAKNQFRMSDCIYNINIFTSVKMVQSSLLVGVIKRLYIFNYRHGSRFPNQMVFFFFFFFFFSFEEPQFYLYFQRYRFTKRKDSKCLSYKQINRYKRKCWL